MRLTSINDADVSDVPWAPSLKRGGPSGWNDPERCLIAAETAFARDRKILSWIISPDRTDGDAASIRNAIRLLCGMKLIDIATKDGGGKEGVPRIKKEPRPKRVMAKTQRKKPARAKRRVKKGNPRLKGSSPTA